MAHTGAQLSGSGAQLSGSRAQLSGSGAQLSAISAYLHTSYLGAQLSASQCFRSDNKQKQQQTVICRTEIGFKTYFHNGYFSYSGIIYSRVSLLTIQLGFRPSELFGAGEPNNNSNK